MRISRKTSAKISKKMGKFGQKIMQKFHDKMRKSGEKYRIFKKKCKNKTFIKVKEEKLFI